MIKQIVIFGFGYVAQNFVESFLEKEDAISFVSSRDVAKFRNMLNLKKIEIFDFNSDFSLIIQNATHIVISTPTENGGDPAINALNELYDKISYQNLKKIIYLSSSSVYGDHQGQWVDEASDLNGISEIAKARINAEKQVKEFANRFGIPYVVLRLTGIYGPGRNFIMRLQSNAKPIARSHNITSRIYVEDASYILFQSIISDLSGTYNVSDDEPCPSSEIIEYVCNIMNFKQSDFEFFEPACMKDLKKVSNAKIKQDLNIALRYPNYRIAYDALVK